MSKKFETLSDWNEFMKGRNVLIINQNHEWKNEKCSFVEMIGEKEKLKEQKPDKIKMKVLTKYSNELLLRSRDFMIIDGSKI